MYYVDTSALVKLIMAESESIAVRGLLGDAQWLTSELGRVELLRTLVRVSQDAMRLGAALMDETPQMRLTTSIMSTAATMPPAILRSLDAIHVASALQVDGLTAVVTYDLRMQSACEVVSLPWVAPG